MKYFLIIFRARALKSLPIWSTSLIYRFACRFGIEQRRACFFKFVEVFQTAGVQGRARRWGQEIKGEVFSLDSTKIIPAVLHEILESIIFCGTAYPSMCV